MSRKNRQEAKLKEEQEMINEGKIKLEIEAPENNGTVVVGCMTDARDITTFKPLDTISAVKGYSYHYLDFVNYEEMEGKFIAMLVEQENGVSEVDYSSERNNSSYLSKNDLPILQKWLFLGMQQTLMLGLYVFLNRNLHMKVLIEYQIGIIEIL